MFKYSSAVFALFFYLSAINCCQWSPDQCGCPFRMPNIYHRIVGGQEALPQSWPWIVSVRLQGQHICGGVAISDQYILSAAHCFRNYHWNMISLYSFVMGHHKINEIKFTSEAKRIIIHSLYTSHPRLNNDIALIELKTKVDLNKNNVGFICLPTEHVKEEDAYPLIGRKAWVVGWGALVYDGEAANQLQQVSVPITNNSGCQKSLTNSKTQICAGYDVGGRDSCQGDSGGPLVLARMDDTFELIGIVSFGQGCAGPMKPGIYTRVTAYISWIANLTNNLPSISSSMSSNSFYSSNQLQAHSLSRSDSISISFLSFIFLLLTSIQCFDFI